MNTVRKFLWGYWAIFLVGIPLIFSILQALFLIYVKGMRDGGKIYSKINNFKFFLIPVAVCLIFLFYLLPESLFLGEDWYLIFIMPIFSLAIFICGNLYIKKLVYK